MTEVSKEQYLDWQNKLQSKNLFRRHWQFWSNYSAVFYVIAFLSFIVRKDFLEAIVVTAVGFVLTRWVIVVVINYFYKRERPYQKYNFAPITSRFFSQSTKLHNSFPSRHLTTLGLLTGVVLLYSPIYGAGLILVTVITGIARVILGYHYPTDILAGFIIGLITAFISYQLCILLLFT